MADELGIGIDLGATKIAAALVDSRGNVRTSSQAMTLPKEGAAAVLDRMAGEVRKLTANGGMAVAGVGVGSPGLVDSREGIVRNAVNLGWREVPVASELSRRLGGIPVRLENDANAAAVGEGVFGAAKGAADYVVLTVGSGLGAGAVAGGRLVTGSHWMATDLGHLSVDPDNGPRCVCGRRGCAETVVSGPGLVRVVRELLGAGAGRSTLVDSSSLSAQDVLEAAREGDSVAAAALDRLAGWLGQIAAIAAAVIDPAVVVIGGGLGTAAGRLLVERMREEMNRRLPLHVAECDIPVRISSLASSAVGAASLIWQADR